MMNLLSRTETSERVPSPLRSNYTGIYISCSCHSFNRFRPEKKASTKNMAAAFRLVATPAVILMLAAAVLIGGPRVLVEALSMDYYALSCPLAEFRVRSVVSDALRKDPTLSGPLLRMHFHDCFVQGCDGSILIDSSRGNMAEKDSPANLSLRGFEVVDQIKQLLEAECPGAVSCADILAMTARDAVLLAGGPLYDIPKGRKDGRRSRIEDTISLPPPFFNSSDLIRVFGQRGFTVQDLVALSGAHTLGVARCSSFKNRLGGLDPSLDSNFAAVLARACSAGDAAEMPLDWTRTSFDTAYFRALQMGGGVLTSDQTLFTSPQTAGLVNAYAMNGARFFFDFSAAMVKMGLLGVKEGGLGEVRTNCRRIN